MNKTRTLFDFQKYEKNEKLAEVISETESRHMGVSALNEDELDMVNAGLTKPSVKASKTDSKRGSYFVGK